MRDYTDVITLISVEWIQDDYGVERPVESKLTVQCAVRSEGQAAFFAAQTAGFKADKVFIIHPIEYNEQTDVEFKGKKYSIYRTYQVDDENLELHARSTIGGLMQTVDEWANQMGVEFLDYSGFEGEKLHTRTMTEGDFKRGMAKSRVRPANPKSKPTFDSALYSSTMGAVNTLTSTINTAANLNRNNLK